MYLIKRVDSGGGYVSKPGSEKSYTRSIERAKTFASRKEAEGDLCVENEVVVSLREILGEQ